MAAIMMLLAAISCYPVNMTPQHFCSHAIGILELPHQLCGLSITCKAMSLSAGEGAIAVKRQSQEGAQGAVEAGVGVKKMGAEAGAEGLLQPVKALQVDIFDKPFRLLLSCLLLSQ